jgi:Septum formation
MSTEATGDGKPPLDPAQARADPAAPAANAESGDADEPDEGYEHYQEHEQYEQYAEYEDYEADEAAEPRRARRWPRVLLVLGFVVLAIVIIGGAVAIVGSLTHGFKKPVKVTYKASPVFSLKTGDCFDPQGQQSYTLVTCDTPHQAEVFATFVLTGTSWPGSAAVQHQASSGCASRLTGYVNPQLAISLSSTYVYPDETAWQAGTRTVICEVRAASGQLTGSVRGASASAG